MAKKSAINFAESSKYEWLIIVVAIFVLRITPWIISEYWYDEVLTLGDFAMDADNRGLWQSVFRNYPIANNHILSSAIYWCWLRIINFNLMYEQFTRLPSIAFGIGLIAICVCHWRRWLGGRMANLGGLLLAISPVYTAYAYQIRGYSMSMFLCALAISGMLKYNAGEKRSGQLILCACSLLLPLTIPSNLLFVIMIAAVLACSCREIKQLLLAAMPPLLSAAVGASYYFTIWPQFVRASKEPNGWSSCWAVAGNLLLAFAVHALVMLIALGMSLLSHKKKVQASEAAVPLMPAEPTPAAGMRAVSPLIMLLSTIIVIALTLLAARKGQAPFPRVFLPFFISTSFALMLTCARRNIGYSSFPLLFVSILFVGMVSERISSDMTKQQLAAGISPNNLLQQYYRGSDELRTAALAIGTSPQTGESLIITDEYDFPTMRMYSMLAGIDGSHIVTRTFAKQDFLQNMPHSPEYPLFIIAKNRCTADELLDYSGYCKKEKAVLRPLLKLDIRHIYTPFPLEISPVLPNNTQVL